MSVRIVDGFLVGTLLDDKDREWPIKRFPQVSARGPLTINVPNLVMHTTETDGYIETLRFPSQWQCGEGILGQHIRLGLSGDAVNNWDTVAQQIEMVGRSQVGVWLPKESTLGPAVALTAWLHKTGRIKTGLKRPTEAWPTVVDRLPAAVESYYRRRAGLWPNTPGVYGHIEIPDNSHWDPGGFNYDKFFERVSVTLMGGEEAMRLDEYWDGEAAYRAAYNNLNGDPGPVPDGHTEAFNRGWSSARWAARNPGPGAHKHPEKAEVGHGHNIKGETI